MGNGLVLIKIHNWGKKDAGCFTETLAKPLADGSFAIAFINVSGEEKGAYSVTADALVRMLGHRMTDKDAFAKAKEYRVVDLWTGEASVSTAGCFAVDFLPAYGNVTVRVTPV